MKFLAFSLVLLFMGMLGAAAFVWSGLYDISATDNHLAPTYHVIRKPQQADPKTAMPDMGIGEAHARDMVAYLYTLK